MTKKKALPKSVKFKVGDEVEWTSYGIVTSLPFQHPSGQMVVVVSKSNGSGGNMWINLYRVRLITPIKPRRRK